MPSQTRRCCVHATTDAGADLSRSLGLRSSPILIMICILTIVVMKEPAIWDATPRIIPPSPSFEPPLLRLARRVPSAWFHLASHPAGPPPRGRAVCPWARFVPWPSRVTPSAAMARSEHLFWRRSLSTARPSSWEAACKKTLLLGRQRCHFGWGRTTFLAAGWAKPGVPQATSSPFRFRLSSAARRCIQALLPLMHRMLGWSSTPRWDVGALRWRFRRRGLGLLKRRRRLRAERGGATPLFAGLFEPVIERNAPLRDLSTPNGAGHEQHQDEDR